MASFVNINNPKRRISEYSNYYRVRIFRNGEAVVDRSFSFKEYGSKSKALKNAQLFRDKLEAEVVAGDGSEHWDERYANYIAGVVLENNNVVARIKNKNEYTIERFSFLEYGLRKAFLKAIKSLERRRLNGEKYPVSVVKKSYKLLQARFEELQQS